MLIGSYFGDWDNQNNVLRAPLASRSTFLGSMWAGRPHWVVHHMGLGETMGYAAWVSQNQRHYYSSYSRSVHIALMGDPTLRLHIIKPVTGLSVAAAGSTINIDWTAPQDNIIGYNIYRATTLQGTFEKVNTGLVTGNTFTDASPHDGNNVYMVRAIKRETSGAGTYFNMSTGKIDSVFLQPISNTPPSVAITAPAAGTAFTLGDAVAITAEASDADGTVAGVAFRVDGNEVAASAASPHAHTWSPQKPGTYALSAVATDDDGATAVSQPVTVTVAERPLPTPDTLHVSQGQYFDFIKVDWSIQSKENFYKLYRSTEPNDTINAEPITGWTQNLNYKDCDVQQQEEYYYYLRVAADQEGYLQSRLSQGFLGFLKQGMPTRRLKLPKMLKFNETMVGDTSTLYITVKNTGNANVSIDSISFPRAFAGNWQKGVLEPGQEQELAFYFIPTEPEPYFRSVVIHSNATPPQVRIEVQGKGEAIVSSIQKEKIEFLQVAPNPVNSYLNLKLRDGQMGEVYIELMDISGKTVKESYAFSKLSTEWETQIDFSHLPRGVYLLYVQMKDKINVTRLVKD